MRLAALFALSLLMAALAAASPTLAQADALTVPRAGIGDHGIGERTRIAPGPAFATSLVDLRWVSREVVTDAFGTDRETIIVDANDSCDANDCHDDTYAIDIDDSLLVRREIIRKTTSSTNHVGIGPEWGFSERVDRVLGPRPHWQFFFAGRTLVPEERIESRTFHPISGLEFVLDLEVMTWTTLDGEPVLPVRYVEDIGTALGTVHVEEVYFLSDRAPIPVATEWWTSGPARLVPGGAGHGIDRLLSWESPLEPIDPGYYRAPPAVPAKEDAKRRVYTRNGPGELDERTAFGPSDAIWLLKLHPRTAAFFAEHPNYYVVAGKGQELHEAPTVPARNEWQLAIKAEGTTRSLVATVIGLQPDPAVPPTGHVAETAYMDTSWPPAENLLGSTFACSDEAAERALATTPEAGSSQVPPDEFYFFDSIQTPAGTDLYCTAHVQSGVHPDLDNIGFRSGSGYAETFGRSGATPFNLRQLGGWGVPLEQAAFHPSTLTFETWSDRVPQPTGR